MANFTYEIPEQYRSSFQGFVNPDQNKIYIGGPNSPIVNDDQARRLIMEVTGLDSNIVFTFAGGPQDLDFFLGVPLMNAVITKDANTIDFYRTTGRTGDVSENYPDMDTTRFRRVPPASSFNPTIANIDQGLASFDLTDSGYKNTAKQNIENNREASIDDTKKKISGEAGKSSGWLEDAIAKYNKNANDWMLGGSAAEDGGNFWTVLGDSLAESGEAIKIEDLIANPQQFLQTLQGEDAKLIYTDESTGIQSLNPWVAMAMDIATEQSGYVNKQQLALLENAGAFQIAKMNKDSQLAYAKEEGLSAKDVAQIRADADVEIAEISEFNRQQEFNYLNQKEDLQFRLQQQAATNEYNLLIHQGEKSDKASDRQHAETMKQFEIQKGQWETQQQQQQLHHTEAMQQFENQLASGELLAALEREAREAEVNLRSEDINRQMERDRITAETNQKIEEIRRLSAGDVAGIDKQIAEREAERDEKLAELEQATITTTGAQQLQATLAGTEAQKDIATTQAAMQKEAQLAIQALQNSAAINELDKAEAIATIQSDAQTAGQLAQQQLRETTILGELDKAKAIAELQQEMQITAQTAMAGLQNNQALSELEKAEAIAQIQEDTRQATNIAIAELQANQALTELDKTEIIAGLQATATTTAATTQAGAVTGAAALQAEAASPFGYVGAGVDAADRAQRLTDAEAILGQQYNPYGLSNEQFTGMQNVAAQAGATPFGALSTAPDARYQDILGVQQAEAAAGPFQAAQLGQGMGDISTILRGGLTPEQQLALAQAPGNPFGFTANEAMALQNSLARGGLTPTQRLAEVQAGAAPQNMANYLNFIGNPAAVGFAGQSGFLQNIADSPEGNIPASLFGLNVPQSSPTVPTNPTMADLSGLTDEQLGFYQGQQAAQNYQTPSQIFQQAQTVTPQGV